MGCVGQVAAVQGRGLEQGQSNFGRNPFGKGQSGRQGPRHGLVREDLRQRHRRKGHHGHPRHGDLQQVQEHQGNQGDHSLIIKALMR